MFDNDFPLLSAASLVALILHRAGSGPVTLTSCEDALANLFRQANEDPGLPEADLRSLLAGHLKDLEIARILKAAGQDGWELTPRGRHALKQHPEGLDQTDLVKYPEFAAHLRNTAHQSCGMDPRMNSYDEGYLARRRGLSFTANPYAFDNVDHQSWENGWMEALEERQG
ncbi:hypothetical protein RA20_01775 [Leisingera sp. ANG-Vp]|nr:hypothetical protein RA20_01775 [Leisingera sp. ANG-Vp]